MPRLLWFRRDLRLADHPALRAAAEAGPVAGVFVLDPALWAAAGATRRAWVAANLLALRDSAAGAPALRIGDPADVLPGVAAEIEADRIHLTAEPSAYGHRRDSRVAAALAGHGITGIPGGTPYAVPPGEVHTQQGGGYRVFTPFARAWRERAVPAPLPVPTVDWVRLEDDPEAATMLAEAVAGSPVPLPEPGEAGAHRIWAEFRDTALADYAEQRDRPDRPGTSRLSPYLKVGAIHPRQLLADLPREAAPGSGTDRFVSELIWREFYADVLRRRPESAWADLNPLGVATDPPGPGVAAWREGRTGFPVVDAGMRQLRATGWMHNRVRMITASFLTKDLHVDWQVGARHFLDLLLDGDPASNNHGWQWVAGTGTDASPYFRIFNPVTQGLRFDPDGDYVRRWVPELAHLSGRAAHEPWRHAGGYDHGYPEPILDHAAERAEALARYSVRPGPPSGKDATSS